MLVCETFNFVSRIPYNKGVMALNPKQENDDLIIYMDNLLKERPASPPPGVEMLNNNRPPTFGDQTPSPLLETDNTNNPKPTRGPEIDDLDPRDEHPSFHGKRPHSRGNDEGIDDGFLPERPEIPDEDYPNSFDRRPSFAIGPTWIPPGSITPDMNIYQQKKTIAQGMMDLALLSANANQMRYVLQNKGRHPYYYPSLVMIGMSLILQVVVGIGLIWNSRYNVKVDVEMCKANRANNWTVIGIFLVTILNVFISSFGVVESLEN